MCYFAVISIDTSDWRHVSVRHWHVIAFNHVIFSNYNSLYVSVSMFHSALPPLIFYIFLYYRELLNSEFEMKSLSLSLCLLLPTW